MEKRYLRIEVNPNFAGLGAESCPVYIPVLVESSNPPLFSIIQDVASKPMLITEEEFELYEKKDFAKKYEGE